MTSAQTDYGVSLGKQDSTMAYPSIGEVVSIDPPELMTPAVEATNHGSGGFREYVPSKLEGLAEFTVTLNRVTANVQALRTLARAGTKGNFQIAYPNSQKDTFAAYVTSIKPGTHDAQNPAAMTVDVKFQPTDSLAFDS